MVASLVGANAVDQLTEIAFPFSLVVVVLFSLPIAFAVTWLTPPESPEVLRRFYERVRPAGAWAPVAEAAGLPAKPLGWRPWLDVGAATLGIYAAIAGTNALFFGTPASAAIGWVLAIALLAFSIRSAAQTPD